VIFFNNVGYLGMCGHGTIGLVASLSFAGRLAPGSVKIDTPVGAVEAHLHAGWRGERRPMW
jgi:4-hydroxyproline epimerase